MGIYRIGNETLIINGGMFDNPKFSDRTILRVVGDLLKDMENFKKTTKKNKSPAVSEFSYPWKTIDDVIAGCAKTLEVDTEELIKWLKIISTLHIGAVIDLLSKYISLELEKNYPKFNEDYYEMFCISRVTGNINRVPYNTKGVIGFRTYKDTQYVKNILQPLYNIMFSGK